MKIPFAYILGFVFLTSCSDNKIEKKPVIPYSLSIEEIEGLVLMPLSCVEVEYPNKLNQVLANGKDLLSPRVLHPSFYGCFDWHSALHGHWTMMRLLRLHPGLTVKDSIISVMHEHINEVNINAEIEYFNRLTEKSFERTYGWAWLLKFQEELDKSEYTELKKALQPLSDLIIKRYQEFLPKLTYPIRVGEHTNTAFGLSLAYDYAISSGDKSFKKLIEDTANRFYADDNNCPLYWEPSGFDFLSPCLEEANLMSKIMTTTEFNKWTRRFLPELLNYNFNLNPATVSDRSDGKLAHLDGLNFSRAWCLKNIGRKLDNPRLIEVSNDHIEFSKSKISDGNYSGDHWLGSFLTLATVPIE